MSFHPAGIAPAPGGRRLHSTLQRFHSALPISAEGQQPTLIIDIWAVGRYAVAGVPNMGGSAALKGGALPAEDCFVVARLREAGAVFLGKLSTTEGAMGGYNEQLTAHPIPTNPWDPTSWAGASSSGSGVASAAGMAFTTLGSDTGGSIRFPAAACGVVGIKARRCSSAVGETVILLHPPLHLEGVSLVIWRGRHQNDSLTDGYCSFSPRWSR